MKTLSIYETLSKIPLGKRIFSAVVCLRLPYFLSIRPRIVELTEGRSVVEMDDRWFVHNHLGIIHAIAMCNLCELSMAMTVEVTIPDHLRFIPSGMNVDYRKKAKGVLRAISEVKPEDFNPGEMAVHVDVFDREADIVACADIHLNIKTKD